MGYSSEWSGLQAGMGFGIGVAPQGFKDAAAMMLPHTKERQLHRMNEASTTVAPETVPAANIKHKSPGLLNQAQARALTKAEQISLAAQHPDHASALDAREISKDFVAQLLSDVDTARDQAASAVASTTARINATADATTAAYSLIGGLQEVQKAARQRYARTNRIALNDYLIGEKLNGSKPNLLQTSQTILNKAGADVLPGITPAKLKALRATRQAWIDASTAQSESKAGAQSQRAELKAAAQVHRGSQGGGSTGGGCAMAAHG